MQITDEMVEKAGKAVVAEWQKMVTEMSPHMTAGDVARSFVSPGNHRLIRAALADALPEGVGAQAEPAALAGLNYVIQYRRKSGGIRWINMAAFDSESVAERYCQDLQTADKPWQYRMMPLAAALSPAQAEPADVAGLIERLVD